MGLTKERSVGEIERFGGHFSEVGIVRVERRLILGMMVFCDSSSGSFFRPRRATTMFYSGGQPFAENVLTPFAKPTPLGDMASHPPPRLPARRTGRHAMPRLSLAALMLTALAVPAFAQPVPLHERIDRAAAVEKDFDKQRRPIRFRRRVPAPHHPRPDRHHPHRRRRPRLPQGLGRRTSAPASSTGCSPARNTPGTWPTSST